LLPAASSTAPAAQLSADRKEAIRSGTVALTCLASLAGLPAAVLARLDVQGGPVGLCAIAGPGQDRALLDLVVGQAATTPTR
jgi:Asp-tRNA(Asn)/Glu-tRNA(Gln) amidotransferase A subunit family amidase